MYVREAEEGRQWWKEGRQGERHSQCCVSQVQVMWRRTTVYQVPAQAKRPKLPRATAGREYCTVRSVLGTAVVDCVRRRRTANGDETGRRAEEGLGRAWGGGSGMIVPVCCCILGALWGTLGQLGALWDPCAWLRAVLYNKPPSSGWRVPERIRSLGSESGLPARVAPWLQPVLSAHHRLFTCSLYYHAGLSRAVQRSAGPHWAALGRWAVDVTCSNASNCNKGRGAYMDT